MCCPLSQSVSTGRYSDLHAPQNPQGRATSHTATGTLQCQTHLRISPEACIPSISAQSSVNHHPYCAKMLSNKTQHEREKKYLDQGSLRQLLLESSTQGAPAGPVTKSWGMLVYPGPTLPPWLPYLPTGIYVLLSLTPSLFFCF